MLFDELLERAELFIEEDDQEVDMEEFHNLVELMRDNITELKRLVQKSLNNDPFKDSISTDFAAQMNVLLGNMIQPKDKPKIELFTWIATYPISRVQVGLHIDGWEACNAFRQIYINHRRILELILKNSNVRLVDFVPYPKSSKYRGEIILKQLDSYFPQYDKEDDDDYFTEYQLHFEAVFHFDDSDEKLFSTFRSLAVLFDSCYHYLTPRKDIDRILKHYNSIKGTAL